MISECLYFDSRYILLTNGVIIDLYESTWFGYRVKGQTLYRTFESKNPHFEDETVEIGIIDCYSNDRNELEKKAFEYRVVNRIEEFVAKCNETCVRINNCEYCHLMDDDTGICEFMLANELQRRYENDKLTEDEIRLLGDETKTFSRLLKTILKIE